MQSWIGADRRRSRDVDFLATYPRDEERTRAQVISALAGSPDVELDGFRFDPDRVEPQRIWETSDAPGLRLTASARSASGETEAVQIDIGYGDPMVDPPQRRRLELGDAPGEEWVELLTPSPETAFAWKCHGLVERDDHAWRPKDLADLWQLWSRLELDPGRLRAALALAFESRDAPMWLLDRLAEQRMGQSSGSRRSWRRLRRSEPERELPDDLADVVGTIGTFVRPHWVALRTEDRPTWPREPTLAEMRAAIRGAPEFSEYPWGDGGAVFTYERISKTTFPDPFVAATRCECRRRMLLREARGITFAADGRILARPYPRFDAASPEAGAAGDGWSVTEKLDGSLVFATPLGGSWVWRTRRGRSEIADRAGAYAAADRGYAELVERTIDEGCTALFEWCSRTRPIVLDHPEDRLVLTGVRDHASGELWSRARVSALAERFGVECVREWPGCDDFASCAATVAEWRDREGLVASVGQRLVKFKSPHYELLHRAVEGPGRDRARWALILSGRSDALCRSSSLRGVDLHGYADRLLECMGHLASSVREAVRSVPDDSGESRRRLAEVTSGSSGPMRAACFAVFDGEDPDACVRRLVARQCRAEKSFRRMIQDLHEPPLERR